MKKVTSIIIILSMLLAMTINAGAVSGKGTEANPFRISTEEELLLLADFPEAYFELENDIELTSAWTPVTNFSGSLNGKGHQISISSFKLYDYTGLFGTLSGSVKNLNVYANDLEIQDSNDFAGLIAGLCTGTVEGCKASGTISLDGYGSSSFLNFGGLCGTLEGSVSKCFSNFEAVTLDSLVYYGGIASTITKTGTIVDCTNYDLSFSSDYGATYYSGIAYDNGGTITNCYSVGGNGSSSGKYGISESGTMNNCYYDKNVIGYTGTSSAYGIPKSTLAMKMEATFANWDFENTWAIDESEENPINNGYPYLRVFYEDYTSPITLSQISVAEGNLVVDTKITDTSDSYVLHIALFDSSDRLCEYVVIPNSRQLKDVFAIIPDSSNATYAKIFTWSGLNQIEPIAQNEIIEIVR